MEYKDYALLLGGLIVGFFLGYGYMADEHNEIMVSKEKEYLTSLEEARNKERQWQNKAQEIENEYQKNLIAIRQSNDITVDRLRSQLDSYSKRLSSCSKSSNRTNGSTGTTSVPREIKNLVNFSEQCARRADELILQVNGLQKWYKETSQ